jgi:hypothetical protein
VDYNEGRERRTILGYDVPRGRVERDASDGNEEALLGKVDERHLVDIRALSITFSRQNSDE